MLGGRLTWGLLLMFGLFGCGGGGADNEPPTARIVGVAPVFTGTTVGLDGTGSSDPEGALLLYAWTVVQRPGGSTAQIVNPNSATPTFIPDRAGDYVIALSVSDGELLSDPAQVTLNASVLNLAPQAVIAPVAGTVARNATVTLDGTGSNDPNGDALTYRWVLATRPVGSTATLIGADTVQPSFLADLAGTYSVTLVVSDGVLSSRMTDQFITATNVLPLVAHAGPDITTTAGSRVVLDGSASTDPYGGPLEYTWRLTSRPYYSGIDSLQAIVMQPDFVPDVIGDYVFSLVVNRPGTAETSPPDTVTVTVPGAGVVVQGAFVTTWIYPLPYTATNTAVRGSDGRLIVTDPTRSLALASTGGSFTLANVRAFDPSGTVVPTWNLVDGQQANGPINFFCTAPPAGVTVNAIYTFSIVETGASFSQTLTITGP